MSQTIDSKGLAEDLGPKRHSALPPKSVKLADNSSERFTGGFRKARKIRVPLIFCDPAGRSNESFRSINFTISNEINGFQHIPMGRPRQHVGKPYTFRHRGKNARMPMKTSELDLAMTRHGRKREKKRRKTLHISVKARRAVGAWQAVSLVFLPSIRSFAPAITNE